MIICLIQFDIIWKNPKANLEYISKQILDCKNENVDLIILPEMFTTGFIMDPESVENYQDEIIDKLKTLSIATNAAITGSIAWNESGKFFNRLLFIFPSGEIQTYDKRHLFTLAGEQNSFEKGDKSIMIEYKGFRIRPIICYDLRFPVFCRNDNEYDLLIVVANWPEARIDAWNALLKARAIENMCYVAAVNRIGIDGNDAKYSGDSQVIDSLGNYLVKPFGESSNRIIVLDKDALNKNRMHFGFLNDRDSFNLTDQ